MGELQTISLVGDYAKGMDTVTIEIVICGYQLNHDYLMGLSKKIETQIDRRLQIKVSKDIPDGGIVLYTYESAN